MFIALKSSHERNRIIKKRDIASHKRYHLEKAKRIRDGAQVWREQIEEDVRVNAHQYPENIMAIIEEDYMNMLSQAIAEENSKCMERH